MLQVQDLYRMKLKATGTKPDGTTADLVITNATSADPAIATTPMVPGTGWSVSPVADGQTQITVSVQGFGDVTDTVQIVPTYTSVVLSLVEPQPK